MPTLTPNNDQRLVPVENGLYGNIRVLAPKGMTGDALQAHVDAEVDAGRYDSTPDKDTADRENYLMRAYNSVAGPARAELAQILSAGAQAVINPMRVRREGYQPPGGLAQFGAEMLVPGSPGELAMAALTGPLRGGLAVASKAMTGFKRAATVYGGQAVGLFGAGAVPNILAGEDPGVAALKAGIGAAADTAVPALLNRAWMGSTPRTRNWIERVDAGNISRALDDTAILHKIDPNTGTLTQQPIFPKVNDQQGMRRLIKGDPGVPKQSGYDHLDRAFGDVAEAIHAKLPAHVKFPHPEDMFRILDAQARNVAVPNIEIRRVNFLEAREALSRIRERAWAGAQGSVETAGVVGKSAKELYGDLIDGLQKDLDSHDKGLGGLYELARKQYKTGLHALDLLDHGVVSRDPKKFVFDTSKVQEYFSEHLPDVREKLGSAFVGLKDAIFRGAEPGLKDVYPSWMPGIIPEAGSQATGLFRAGLRALRSAVSSPARYAVTGPGQPPGPRIPMGIQTASGQAAQRVLGAAGAGPAVPAGIGAGVDLAGQLMIGP